MAATNTLSADLAVHPALPGAAEADLRHVGHLLCIGSAMLSCWLIYEAVRLISALS